MQVLETMFKVAPRDMCLTAFIKDARSNTHASITPFFAVKIHCLAITSSVYTGALLQLRTRVPLSLQEITTMT